METADKQPEKSSVVRLPMPVAVICARRRLAYANLATGNISALNSKLADAKIYNDLWRHKINTWNVIRSNADHARFGRNSSSDVANMLEGVRDFLAEFLKS
jgi:hypothetical protein